MRVRKAFRVKEIDITYCMRCRWSLFVYQFPYDFCRYDGMCCQQNDEDNFIFTCQHFDPIPHHIFDSFLISLNPKNF